MLCEYDFRKGSLTNQTGGSNDLTGTNVDWGVNDKGRAIEFTNNSNKMTMNSEVAPGDDMTMIVISHAKETTGGDNVFFAYAGANLAQFDINDNDSLRLYLADTTPVTVEAALDTSTILNKTDLIILRNRDD